MGMYVRNVFIDFLAWFLDNHKKWKHFRRWRSGEEKKADKEYNEKE
jgi:hypothetical protein